MRYKSPKKARQYYLNNNNKGSIVMTPNASVMADEMRPSFNQNKSSRRACITKIRDE